MNIEVRAAQLLRQQKQARASRADRLLTLLLLLEWLFRTATQHPPDPVRIGLPALVAIPLALAFPGAPLNRYWLAFGLSWLGDFSLAASLAALFLYRDWRVLTANLLGLALACSGVGWILLEWGFLVQQCLISARETAQSAWQQASLEAARQAIERDLEERGQLLAESNLRLADRLEARSRFLGTVGQELVSPLNGVMGLASLLDASGLSPEQQSYVENMRRTAGQLLSSVQDVVEYARLEAGQLEVRLGPLDLRACLEEVAEHHALAAHHKGLEMVLDLPPALPAEVIIDACHLRQVLANLLSNAIKFTASGEICLRCEVEPGVLSVTVSDSGDGLNPSEWQRILEPFSQGQGPARLPGMGLGLSICQHLVQLLGGRLDLRSASGAGSQFTVELPLQEVEAARVTPDLEAARLRGTRVLVAEDHRLTRNVLVAQLRAWGCEVCETVDGYCALAKLERSAVDLVLLDLTLPRIDGRETGLLLKRSHPNLPVILLTPAGTAPQEGFAAVLSKPVRAQGLRGAILGALALAAAPQVEAPCSVLEGARVLVVEDNSFTQIVILKYLERWGCQGEAVSTGAEAVRRVETAEFDLVLMDVYMPEMDGTIATRLIRAAEERRGGRRTPVVALTANALAGDRASYLEMGMDDLVLKPVRADLLRTSMARLLRSAPRRMAS